MGALECQAAESFSLDLFSLADRYRSGATSPTQVIHHLWNGLVASRDSAIWIHLLGLEELLAQAQAVEHRSEERNSLPLYGVPFAVKDNIDVAGYPTTAGCAAYRYVAERSAPVVARLMAAGAIFVGKTNMDQFSTGLAGDRSPYGAVSNAFDSSRISGGSSSGSAAAVARGLVCFALGSDTAGSGRVPAACNNIVGLKPTIGALSAEGMVPACRSLDCVAIFALTAEDAWATLQVARGRSALDGMEGIAGAGMGCDGAAEAISPRFAVPRPEQLEFFGDEAHQNAFQQAIGRLESLGGVRAEIDFQPLRDVASMLYKGPWLAERLATLGHFLRSHWSDVYPVTREVLEAGSQYSAIDYFRASHRLESLRPLCDVIFRESDLLVVPTMPTLPKLAEVQDDSVAWSGRLGFYTNFVNLLKLSAIALPAGFTPDGLPHGITVIAPAGRELELCRFGARWQRATDLPLGATGNRLRPQGVAAIVRSSLASQGNSHPLDSNLPNSKAPSSNFRRTHSVPSQACAADHVRVAVAGAHLRGQPLHEDLLRWGGRFVRSCRSAAQYRFMAFLDLKPPRPGLLRDDARPGAVDLEIFDMPVEGFGRLVASVAPPLAIGTVELADGEMVKGFLCESFAAATARDITDFGGWRNFRDQQAHEPSRSDSTFIS
ncbi:MAG TPA: allophanate hydrolase [Pirellulales bacterium]|jgi:allophanate hydrolase|nr:allophanate hydrolase [Pirellulales bacterium]